MTISHQTETQNQPLERKLTLKPARLDFLSTQTQMVFAGFLSLFVVLIAWAPSLQCGFLLDDFLHLDYISRAFHGDWSDFLGNFYSNWAGSDIMKSYRPLVSLSIFTDFIFWKANPWGYHLTNLLLLVGCSAFTGLITLELTGIMGNRLKGVAAIWTALLFAIYPLQTESTSWIIGRVDLLCTLFYLVSVFCYLRFRLIREKKYFALSLAAFIAAILSKEMAYTLPAVITAAALLLKEHSQILAPDEYKRKLRIQAQTAVLTYWTVAGIGLMSRFVLLGTFVGGYGDGGAGGSSGIAGVLSSLRNFFNVDTLKQILFPINLDLIARAGAYDAANSISKILSTAYTGILALGLTRLVMNSLSKRVVAFLAIWTVVSVLPAFQIWHISPNMVGSRLFFLGSAPAIMLLVLLALPAIDAMKPVFAKVFATIGGLLLFVVLSVWTVCLQLNQISWLQASHEVRTFIDSVAKAIAAAPAHQKVLVLNLPTDYSGAGMITRPQYLKYALSLPYFQNNDLASRVLTIEPPVGGSHEFVWPSTLMKLKEDSSRSFVWKESKGFPASNPILLGLLKPEQNNVDSDGALLSWTLERTKDPQNPIAQIQIPFSNFRYVQGADASWTSKEALKIEPIKRTEWTVAHSDGQQFEEITDGLIIRPGTASGITLVADLTAVDSAELNTARVLWKCLSGTCPGIQIAWSGEKNGSVQSGALPINLSLGQASDVRTQDSMLGRYSQNIVWLGRSRAWSLAPTFNKIALQFPPGDYAILFKSLEIIPQKNLSPTVRFEAERDELEFDASKISGCTAVQVIALAPNRTFDAAHPGEIASALSSQSGAPAFKKTLMKTSAKISGAELNPKCDIDYYVRIQALDAENNELGLPSEPVLIVRKNLAERR